METAILSRQEKDGLTITIEYTPYFDECPNDVYGIWSPADNHEGGVTVQYPNAERNCYKFYTSCNYTPAELAKDYAKQGRKNPSKEAYASLQKELIHYLEGYSLQVEITVSCEGVELASDSIGTDFSYEYWNCEEECARECAGNNFSIERLIQEAKKQAPREVVELYGDVFRIHKTIDTLTRLNA